METVAVLGHWQNLRQILPQMYDICETSQLLSVVLESRFQSSSKPGHHQHVDINSWVRMSNNSLICYAWMFTVKSHIILSYYSVDPVF